MKVSDLFEDFDSKKLSQVEFDNLSEPTAKNINDRYRVGKVAFDNEHGLGATPNNANVIYRGFVVCITPSEFLRFAASANRSESAQKMAEQIKAHAPLGAPFLEITYNEKDYGKGAPLRVEVVGHEGRARMEAIRAVNGDSEKIPVHIIPRGEVRARHFDEEFFQALRDRGMVPQLSSKGTEPKTMHVGKIFWMGKTL